MKNYAATKCCVFSHMRVKKMAILPFAEGAENILEFTIVRPFNWIGPMIYFIPGIDGPSEGVPRVLACFINISSFRVRLSIRALNPIRRYFTVYLVCLLLCTHNPIPEISSFRSDYIFAP